MFDADGCLRESLRCFLRSAGRPLFRLSVKGLANVPGEGPCLILPNHGGALDPFWVAQEVPRPVHFMASGHLFRRPWRSRLLRGLGAFPKEKFVRDRASTRVVAELLDAGEVVCVFPEGSRTWDGRTSDPGDGIGHLAARLGAPIVPCRMDTAYHWQPRWARTPRWVPVALEFLPLRRYTPTDDPGAITRAWRAEVEPRVPDVAGPTASWRVAEGLETLLWSCPVCFGLGVTWSRRSTFGCAACSARWTVDVWGGLTGPGGVGSIPRAWDRIAARFGDPPVEDAEAFERDGVFARMEGVTLGRWAGADQPAPVTAGTLVISADALSLHGAATVRWSVPLEDVVGAPLEAGNLATLRVEGPRGVESYALDLGGASCHRWVHFLRHPLTAARLRAGRPAPRLG